MNKNTHSEIRQKVDMSSFMLSIMENSRVGCILLLNGNGIILDSSKGIEDQFGYTLEDLSGKHFSILYTEKDLQKNRPKEELKEALQNGFSMDNNFLIDKKGKEVWCQGESIIVKNKDGERFYIKHVYNIDKQKQLEKSLRAAKKFSEGITETINEAVVVVDSNFNIMMANSYFNKYYNPENKDIKNKSFFEINNEGWNGSTLKDEFQKLLPHNREIKDFEFEYDCPRLGKRILNLNAKQIIQDGEKMEQILIVINDITLQKEATENLSSQNVELNIINKDLDAFVYTASHDLKAPINNLQGLITTLKDDIHNDSKEELMNLIDLSLERLKSTISELAEVGRTQARKGGDKSLIQFPEMLEEIKMMFKKDIESSKAIFKEDFSEAFSIYFSRKNLRSIMQNLISNAIKFRDPKRPVNIAIRTKKLGEYILLEVSDNGIGIKESDKAKVFEMYHRVHNHVEGTGVGLSLVARIIDNNGGKIEIDSEVGKGSTFKVYIKV
jgi:PAS domain S-box-containing protein